MLAARAPPTAAARWAIRGTPLDRRAPVVAVGERPRRARSGSPRRSTTTSCGPIRPTAARRFDAQHAVDSPAQTWRPSIAATDGRARLPGVDRHPRPLHARRPAAGRRSTARGCRAGAPQRLDSTAPPDDQAADAGQRLGAERRRARRHGCSSRGSTSTATTGTYARASRRRRRRVRAGEAGERHAGGERGAGGLAARCDRRDGPLVAFTDWRKSPPRRASSPALRHRARGARRPSAQGRRHRTAHVNAFSPAIAPRRGGAARRLAGHAPRRGRHLARAHRARAADGPAPDASDDGGARAATRGARRSRVAGGAGRSPPGRTTATGPPQIYVAPRIRYAAQSRVARERRPPTK